MALRLEHLTDDEREEWEERAAIMEFDAGMTRGAAELAALRIILDKRGSAMPREVARSSAK